eukprot:COSAG03_NODE_1280_length_4412_cov_1.761651_8_plen_89_part_00
MGKLKDRNSYTSGCKWVVGPRKNSTAAQICPHALDAAEPYPYVYRDSYHTLSEALATGEFPRITTFEVRSQPVLGGLGTAIWDLSFER